MSELPMITFIRGFILLAILLALPTIAVCWNHLPKHLWSRSEPSSATQKGETSQFFQKFPSESAHFASIFMPESSPPVLPQLEAQTVATVREAETLQPYIAPMQGMTLRQVSLEHPPRVSPQDFESLRLHLQTLGVTSYNLDKWGNRGESFRFSCLVAPSKSYVYEKYFQAIGADEIAVIQAVVSDIERWKSVQ
jgi:hypothetical protein